MVDYCSTNQLFQERYVIFFLNACILEIFFSKTIHLNNIVLHVSDHMFYKSCGPTLIFKISIVFVLHATCRSTSRHLSFI